MTPSSAQQPQREHCEHEKVCYLFRTASRMAWINESPCMLNQPCKICDDDTRTRPHPPASEPTPDNAFEVETCTLGVYLSQFPLPSETHTKICLMVNELVIEAKAATASAATLSARKDTIRELLTNFKFGCPGGVISPICDMCGANQYCIELRQSTTAQEPRP